MDVLVVVMIFIKEVSAGVICAVAIILIFIKEIFK